ncbi:PQQ-dependent sugar dehydrogenase [Maribacter sp. MMG018]|uniref:PQQ-dependent sugar dehydrogenase n=1 Tax=Maribacter sp. MMG018 TaxID=2822688 RepID=UPI001B3750DD|nr:PQQ-dependent sugar dehydrogenase [Maribacter sp. MMG018]MBQ4915661.1 PQQ-dependent sugar dehydrogenase [Maribacter sp. MMG018]
MSPNKSILNLIVLFVFFSINLATSQVSYENAFPNLSFNLPVEIQASIDGTNRLFVVEQPGVIKVFPNSPTAKNDDVATFLDLSEKVAYSSGQEIGLLGMAFHPEYTKNGYVFIYYIDRPSNYRINIVRYTISSSNPNMLDPNSEFIIARFTKNQSDSNHNGGKISFGPDGYLYASIGDGGGGGDPQRNGQNLETVFGSILRIDVDINGDNPIETNPEEPDGNYEIPSDNPRVGLSGLDEIYAWGIRNTWKFSFDEQGRLWGADVGQNVYEEINLIAKGGNYGWNKYEANSQPSYGSSTSLITTPEIAPIFFYDHSAGDVSITGGYVYRGSLSASDLQNKYIYADYVSGRVWALEYDEANGTTDNQLLFRTNGELISSFGEDEYGELYFSGYGSSAKIYKLTAESSGPGVTPVNGIGNWKKISSGINGTIETMVESEDGSIYVGGSFTNAGGVDVSNLAIINADGNWESFAEGSNGTIYSLAIADNGDIFAAGDFTQIGGTNANNIAYWNGSDWYTLGDGTNGPVAKIAFDATGTLIVGGVFTTADGITVNNIAQYKDGLWSALTDSSTGIIGTNNEIRAIAFDENNTLYVGGNFDTAGGNEAARIAQWNGSNWSGLGAGTSGFVQAIVVHENYIYAGGNFALSGSQTVNRIARYNRTTQVWEPLGNGLSGNVNDMTSDDNYIYVGGSFETASDDINNNKIMMNTARWSVANGWEALGPKTNVGVDNRVNSILFTKNNTQLIVGGNFTAAGGNPTNNIAVWSETFCTEDSIITEYRINGESNSGSNNIIVKEGSEVVLSLLPNNISFDLTLPDGTIVNGEYTIDTISPEQSGTYIYTTEIGCTKSLVITVGNDQDNDGIIDANDICPNTLEGETVNENGCSANDFSVDQFQITSTGTSCIGSNNGSVYIEAKTANDYIANLSGPEGEASFPFSKSLEISDLQKGTYDLCITLGPTSNYQSCSKIIITEPDPLEVQLDFNSSTNSVTLKMKGGTEYTIDINGKSTHYTDKEELNLLLHENVNNITVFSDQPCLGKFEETVILENSFLAYPNPVENNLTIDLKPLTSTWVEITIFTETGVLLSSKKYEVDQTPVTLDTSSFASGIYILRLKNEKMNESFKLVKL